MRLTPLICIQCGSWFHPKTKRKQKCCSNACRQASYLRKQQWGIDFHFKDDQDEEQWIHLLQEADKRVEASPKDCMDALYEHNHDVYRYVIFRWGVDLYGQNGRQWLAENQQQI
jgi:hypothetical protein